VKRLVSAVCATLVKEMQGAVTMQTKGRGEEACGFEDVCSQGNRRERRGEEGVSVVINSAHVFTTRDKIT
jgi:hypothetical protein